MDSRFNLEILRFFHHELQPQSDPDLNQEGLNIVMFGFLLTGEPYRLSHF